ncbi:PaaI family thioesterase [uncultured Cohaesibacter sp.]|uniref:PaaI family thioesterase n=1 Tax=uncultured Cohaesibacter sp. TaxID=1002546 RepID=UPI0029C92561|nr:PaaI family thioesterase [uncultured Cohaesibacter sp.]
MTQTANRANDWKPMAIEGYMGSIGPLMRRKDESGKNRYGLLITPQHLNAIGLAHGGVITSLIDQVIALEAWNAADRQPTVTVQMDTRFVGSAKAESFLQATAVIKHQTGSMMFVDADVHGDGDALIASATSVMKIIRQKGKTSD